MSDGPALKPELGVDTGGQSLADCVGQVMVALRGGWGGGLMHEDK